MASASKAPINLLRGWPSPSLHPTPDLLSAAQYALTHGAISTPGLQYGPDEGYGPLRQALSAWLGDFYSVPDCPERLCITGGASQNLACALQVFSDPNVTKRVWMVAPCYFLACRIFDDAGFAGRLRAVREDEEGIDVEFLERELSRLESEKPRGPPLKSNRPWSKTYSHIIYCVPTFSNPSGRTMSLRRRTQLVHLARTYDALIITDDVYDFLQWDADGAASPTDDAGLKAVLPRLSDIDRALPPHSSDPGAFGHTLSNGSFSKILGPGVRTGWADGSPALAYGLSQCGSSRSGGCPSQLMATFVTQMLENKSLQTHIATKLVPGYQKRWMAMAEVIERTLAPLGVEMNRASLEGVNVFGGFFIWLRLPEGVNAKSVAAVAMEKEKLVVSEGELFEVYGDEEAVKLNQWLRVCFAWEEIEALTEGIERLGRVIEKIKTQEWLPQAAPPTGEGLQQEMGEYM